MEIFDNTKLSLYEKKWTSIIEGIFPSIKNRSIIRIICFYSEWIALEVKSDPTLDQSIVPKKLSNLKDKLESFDRIEVEGKFYNPEIGVFEFKLKNGKSVPIDTEFEYKLSDEEMIESFGIEFLSKIDRVWAREYSLNKLLNNG